jgi:hypothetical protein
MRMERLIYRALAEDLIHGPGTALLGKHYTRVGDGGTAAK